MGYGSWLLTGLFCGWYVWLCVFGLRCFYLRLTLLLGVLVDFACWCLLVYFVYLRVACCFGLELVGFAVVLLLVWLHFGWWFTCLDYFIVFWLI